MKIGYPCINLTILCQGNKTFRLKSYSTMRMINTINNNLRCLQKILEFNIRNHILFFRITSDLIPFASHPICKFNWQKQFKKKFEEIGSLIKKYDIRISMHPDQFTLINSINQNVLERSIKELQYHGEVLDLLGLDNSAKIQIHIGGVYGDKPKSINRFVSRFKHLEKKLRHRLVIENDDSRYNLKDCILLNKMTNIPVLFDSLHHEVNNCKETLTQAFELITNTWKIKDGLPMVDYSSQQEEKRKGKHNLTLDPEHFKNFLKVTLPFEYDLMLEIKNKERSALEALELFKQIKQDKY